MLTSQEQIDIDKQIADAQETEAKLAEARRQAGAALLKEVLAENAVMIQRKELEKAAEVEEDLRIMAYSLEQDAKAQVLPSRCSPRSQCNE